MGRGEYATLFASWRVDHRRPTESTLERASAVVVGPRTSLHHRPRGPVRRLPAATDGRTHRRSTCTPNATRTKPDAGSVVTRYAALLSNYKIVARARRRVRTTARGLSLRRAPPRVLRGEAECSRLLDCSSEHHSTYTGAYATYRPSTVSLQAP